ncbi:hypothetical protein K470DRAFT_258564 [Piedraia hortae CBS 480.64]|uniref:Uncharacterized protein n=1 Tax=Piedraia hortae CBS 480.64 TaxID=1314780 RepID=A0A6A7BWJ5_9PEZI|nr:hypothetical protein K470DRAFT_258564 [Piedraia hortae CBS 480.64]
MYPLHINRFFQRASVAYGWGILVVAGGGSYYFAKRSINADRTKRAEGVQQQRERQELLRRQEVERTLLQKDSPSSDLAAKPGAKKKKLEDDRDPSQHGAGEPAAVEHAEHAKAGGSKWESSEPFRSQKGDRFS